MITAENATIVASPDTDRRLHLTGGCFMPSPRSSSDAPSLNGKPYPSQQARGKVGGGVATMRNLS
jgi:hypothetical protein